MRANVLLVSALVVAAPAFADEGAARVAIIPVIVAANDRPSASSIFEGVTLAARFRFDLQLVSEEETFVAGSADLSDRVLDCGPNANCIASELKRLDVRLAVVVVANLDLSPPLLGIQLIDCDEAKVIAESIDRFESRAELAETLRTRASGVFDRAGHPMLARLVVRTDPPRANVRVGEGAPPDKLAANAFTLAPGKYPVVATLEDHDDASREVEVVAGHETEVSLVLAKKSSILESPWLWIAAGVAVAGGVTALIIATRPTDSYVCVPLQGASCEP